MRELTSIKEKKLVSHDGLSLSYEVSGNGKKTLIFLHGMGGDVAAWDKIRKFFQERGYTTIGLDLRAHGFSGRPSSQEGYQLSAFAKDIHAIVKEEGIASYVLVGHCLGAMVGYTYALLFPNQATALVFINTGYGSPYFSDRSPIKKLLKKLFPFLIRISPGTYTPRHVDYTKKVYERDFEPIGFLSVLKHNSLKTFFSLTNVVFSLQVLESLSAITTPTLVIGGGKDSIYPLHMSETIHEKIKSSELQVMKEANHPVVLNNPKELSALIYAYLQKISY